MRYSLPVQAASGIIKYMTKPHRREFLEAVLEDINSMKQRALVLQLRTKWLSMCAKEKQLKQELSEIVNKARVAGKRDRCCKCIWDADIMENRFFI